uniref:valine--tRNA ligase n=1 Tax=Paulinella chromatophora TaxID=39717 RepID=B1X4F0_PAUCH|nr:t-RNA synthetase, class Ia:Valyl-tRNA [Paulinella chromatophora]ACB42819.1 t-RNA synthetase, class Ia:Valyl-tRNA [Paulinella chromatophora]
MKAVSSFNNASEMLAKVYEPVETEARWQKAWEESRIFHPDPNAPGEPFSVVIPPPNVTGSLHMGHAFNSALIDTIVRFQRLLGKNTLCLPGTDHASIAVQTILERQLKEQGKSKEDLGRKGFLDLAWRWKVQSGGIIVNQMRRLGYSADWQRERFTLDKGLNDAVIEAFVLLHEQGLIYRGEYLVNWCPASNSAVSDLEVETRDVKGSLWYFRYPLKNSSAYLEIATTRPETLLGDVAVAVNPDDKRYKSLVGQKLILPLVGREIFIIADDHVDANFGTGCVKVTPAHDPNDFAIGMRHNLSQVTVIDKNGSMNDMAGIFAGLDRFQARKAVVAAMEAKGLLVKIETYQHSIPYSDRGKVPIEPLLSFQWFVNAEPLALNCREALDTDHLKFVPKRWEKVYRNWLIDIRDWCISRQLWWGHQIPVWFVISETNSQLNEHTPYIVARTSVEALEQARECYGDKIVINQDEDVLDTWFSSGLWPFSTLGWPDSNSADFQCWYPNSTLVTGFDIIFFWVARMTMMASSFTKKMPFKEVYIHGLVRDENNCKMSKSMGNGIDPLVLIDRYGADALRFALVWEVAGAGQDIRLDYNRNENTSLKVESSRNFANKIWNACRFTLMNLNDQNTNNLGTPDPRQLKLSDRWILSRLAQVNIEMSEYYSSYNLGEAAKAIYEFTWNDLCDWFIELAKRRINSDDYTLRQTTFQVLMIVLEQILVMLHPLMPHITEELWHGLMRVPANVFLANQPWPMIDRGAIDNLLEQQFLEFIEAIRIVRNLRTVAGLKPNQFAPVLFVTKRSDLAAVLKESIQDIMSLTRAELVEILWESPELPSCLSGMSGELQVLLPIDGLVDLEALRIRLERDLSKANKEILILINRLDNPNFINKAPEIIVSEAKTNLEQLKIQSAVAQGRLDNILGF